jgi:hypothetical protein
LRSVSEAERKFLWERFPDLLCTSNNTGNCSLISGYMKGSGLSQKELKENINIDFFQRKRELKYRL